VQPYILRNVPYYRDFEAVFSVAIFMVTTSKNILASCVRTDSYTVMKLTVTQQSSQRVLHTSQSQDCVEQSATGGAGGGTKDDEDNASSSVSSSGSHDDNEVKRKEIL
jgi:hypothetical protein